ncbi:MAG: glycosyltransferase family A protein [Candidatus Brocadiia bacterium]
MSERPLVSVIMPAYNAEAFVGEAIESALAQGYRPLEVLVADDGSSDATARVVKAFGGPVRYLWRRSGGPAAARNTALRAARGDYIAFLDSDDLWHPRKLEVQLGLMEARPEVAICGTRMLKFRNRGGLTWEPVPPEPEVRPICGDSLLMRNRFSTSTVLARAEAVRRAGEFDEDIFGPEDWDMWRRILQGGCGLHLRAVLAAYRERDDSISDNAARMLANNRKVLGKAFRDNPEMPRRRRLKAVSYMHLDAALEYGKGRRGRALAEVAKSFLLWPLPLGRANVRSLLRLKLTACLALGLGAVRTDGDIRSEGDGG